MKVRPWCCAPGAITLSRTAFEEGVIACRDETLPDWKTADRAIRPFSLGQKHGLR